MKCWRKGFAPWTKGFILEEWMENAQGVEKTWAIVYISSVNLA